MDLWLILPLFITLILIITFLYYIRKQTDLSYINDKREDLYGESKYAKAVKGLNESPPNFKEVTKLMEEKVREEIKDLLKNGKYQGKIDQEIQAFLKKCATVNSKNKVLSNDFKKLYKDFMKVKALMNERYERL